MRDQPQILLVDDDADVVTVASLRLRAAGYDVRTACSGEDGVDAARARQPDAIVLDVQMPRMDGIQAISELRDRLETAWIPIIMLSASIADRQRALKKGARFFLTKPYAGAKLIEAIEKAIVETNHPDALLDDSSTKALHETRLDTDCRR